MIKKKEIIAEEKQQQLTGCKNLKPMLAQQTRHDEIVRLRNKFNEMEKEIKERMDRLEDEKADF